MEKGWLLEGVPATKGQAQQLVAAGHVPDKVHQHACLPTDLPTLSLARFELCPSLKSCDVVNRESDRFKGLVL